MPDAIATPERFETMHFPLAGIDVVLQPVMRQMPRPVIDGTYARTTPVGLNVRSLDPTTLRLRGGARSGLSKYIAQPLIPGWIVQELNTLVTDFGVPIQLSQSGRVVYVVGVSQGNVFSAPAGATTWTQAVNGTGATPPLNFSGTLQSTPLNQKLWFADGVNQAYWDPAQGVGGTVLPWVPLFGTFPVDSQGNRPRLISTWQGRIVQAGLLFDPQNWFMTAIGDVVNGGNGPLDFNYFRVPQSPTQAIDGTNAPQGLVGDVITGLCPYSDDILIFFGDHTIWMMKGNPMSGGQLDLISDAIGGVWGTPWAKDPYGTVYFVSNKMGIYAFDPRQTQLPVRISQPIEELLLGIDTGAYTIRPIWDDRYQALRVFISPTVKPVPTFHFCYETRTGAWFLDQFANVNFDPLAMTVFDGNTASDRLALIGSWDGFVRTFTPNSATDDGYPINSSVFIGPILTKDMDAILVKDVQMILGATSGSVNGFILTGASAEQALTATPIPIATWQAGRNLDTYVRRSAHAHWIKLTSTNQWAMESVRARIAAKGKVQRRGP